MGPLNSLVPLQERQHRPSVSPPSGSSPRHRRKTRVSPTQQRTHSRRRIGLRQMQLSGVLRQVVRLCFLCFYFFLCPMICILTSTEHVKDSLKGTFASTKGEAEAKSGELKDQASKYAQEGKAKAGEAANEAKQNVHEATR